MGVDIFRIDVVGGSGVGDGYYDKERYDKVRRFEGIWYVF